MRLTSCAEGLSRQRNTDARAGLSRPLLDESRSLFHCYINEEERDGVRASLGDTGTAMNGFTGSGGSNGQVEMVGLVVQNMVMETRAEREAALLAHFNIPNFVNSELSALGDEDLLLGDPPIIMEEGRPRCTYHIID